MFLTGKLYNNWVNATINNDNFLKEETLVSKLGELLYKDRKDLINSLSNRGVVVNLEDKDNFIIAKMIEQIIRSSDYSKELILMILEKDGRNKSEFQSGKGKTMLFEASDILQVLAKNPSFANYVQEAKNQFIFLNAEGKQEPKPMGEFTKCLLYSGIGIMVFVVSKMIYNSVKSNNKKSSKNIKGISIKSKEESDLLKMDSDIPEQE